MNRLRCNPNLLPHHNLEGAGAGLAHVGGEGVDGRSGRQVGVQGGEEALRDVGRRPDGVGPAAGAVPAQEVQALDSTGAGDAYVGSLAYFLASGQPLSAAVRRAGAIATRSVLKAGTQSSFPSREEVADITAFLLSFANAMEIDLSTALKEKIGKNAVKYPAREFRGKFK